MQFKLNNRKGRKIFTLIDDVDLAEVSKYNWWCVKVTHGNEYVLGRVNGKLIYLHTFIMKTPPKKVVDHINGNTFDNRRSNLRVCSRRENVINGKISKNNTSGATGVYYRKDRQRYTAYIHVNRKKLNLGCFDSLADAVLARSLAEIKHFGVYSPTLSRTTTGFGGHPLFPNLSQTE